MLQCEFWIGLNPGFSNFVVFLLVLGLNRFAAEGIGMFASSLMPTVETAQAICPVFLILFLLFGGFYINQETMPDGAEWVKYTSLFYWGFTALSRNEFSGETFSCNFTPNCVFTGEQQLQLLGFNEYSIWESCIALILIQICFHAFGYIALRFTKTKYDNSI